MMTCVFTYVPALNHFPIVQILSNVIVVGIFVVVVVVVVVNCLMGRGGWRHGLHGI